MAGPIWIEQVPESTETADYRQSVLAEISRGMVRLYKEQFGRGPTKARTNFAGTDIMIVTLEDTFTPASGSWPRWESTNASATPGSISNMRPKANSGRSSNGYRAARCGPSIVPSTPRPPSASRSSISSPGATTELSSSSPSFTPPSHSGVRSPRHRRRPSTGRGPAVAGSPLPATRPPDPIPQSRPTCLCRRETRRGLTLHCLCDVHLKRGGPRPRAALLLPVEVSRSTRPPMRRASSVRAPPVPPPTLRRPGMTNSHTHSRSHQVKSSSAISAVSR
jgi:hypothetical protein